MYALRDATDADRDWLYALNRAAMREYVEATWGSWDEVFQRERFAELFSPDRFQIIVVEGEEIGVLEARREPDRIHLGEIQLLPKFQSRGIGSAVVGDLLAEAVATDIPVELQVLKVNRARALYERLGFVVFGETDTHHLMCARPTAEHASGATSE